MLTCCEKLSLIVIPILSCYIAYKDILGAILKQAVVEVWLFWQNSQMQTVAVEMDSLIVVPMEHVQIALVIMWVVKCVVFGGGGGYSVTICFQYGSWNSEILHFFGGVILDLWHDLWRIQSRLLWLFLMLMTVSHGSWNHTFGQLLFCLSTSLGAHDISSLLHWEKQVFIVETNCSSRLKIQFFSPNSCLGNLKM